MNRSELPAITCDLLKTRETSRVWGAIGLISVLPLIAWKTGARFLNQSLSVAVAITSLLSTVI